MSARSRNPLAEWPERRARQRHTQACYRAARRNGGRFSGFDQVDVSLEAMAYLEAARHGEVRDA